MTKLKNDPNAILSPREQTLAERARRHLERARQNYDAGKAAKTKLDAGAVLTPTERDAAEAYERIVYNKKLKRTKF